jgi:hypothetical protein
LNFDMLPRPSGLARVLDLRDGIWSSIEDGLMPPKGFTVSDGDWTFSVFRSDDEPRLPSLSTTEGKAALRNWLACGAPVVTDTHVPEWASPGGGTGDGSWQDLYGRLIGPRCATAGCHDARGAALSGMLDLSQACTAHRALLQSGACGEPRVKPGDASSLLVDKIESETPRCGARMPPSGSFSEAEAASVRTWVMSGALAPECP